MAAEYIEREAAIAVIEEKQKELCPVGMYSRHAVYGSDREKFDAWQEIIDRLASIPAADVVPVVRCMNCKYRHDDNFCGGRGWPAHLVPDDGYCDSGVRKDGDGDGV